MLGRRAGNVLVTLRSASRALMQSRSYTIPNTPGKTYEREGLVMTRIVCTIGPSTEEKSMMQSIADEGMKIARFNFSHAVDYEVMGTKLNTLRNLGGAHRRVGINFNLRAALLDTKGPEIRSGGFVGGAKAVQLPSGAEVILTTDPAFAKESTAEKVYVDYPSLGKSVTKGGHILLDDGIIKLEVLDPVARNFNGYTETLCRVANKNEVTLGARKGVNLPGVVLDLPAITERDKRDLEWGVINDVDYVAASFIRKGGDVRQVIAYLERMCSKHKPSESNPRNVRPLVISKIENAEAVENFDDILAESDGIMVARGDLGVEIPFQDVFTAQKMMVRKCNEAGKPVIVATQMLDSMMRNPRPTRAEVSDVGNAVLDGADCVMLSGETAAGKYPVESVQAMSKCIVRADKTLDALEHTDDPIKIFQRSRLLRARPKNDPSLSEELETVALCAVVAASEIHADLIITLTRKGTLARAIAKHRPQVPVMCFCTELKVARQLQIYRGLFPVLPPQLVGATVEDIPEAIRTAKEIGWVRTGDKVVVANYELSSWGQSNNVRVFKIQ